MNLENLKVSTGLSRNAKSIITKDMQMVTTMATQRKNNFLNFLKGMLFVFLILLPSILSTPVKGRESGGILIGTQDYHKEVQCLTEAAYFEAANQPEEGIRAVLQVIKNRKEANGFPASFCGVVHQPKQFSYRNNLLPGQIKAIKIKNSLDKEALKKIHYLSELTAQGTLRNDLPDGTLYYAHNKVKNSWTKKFVRVKVIHQHVFYKEI